MVVKVGVCGYIVEFIKNGFTFSGYHKLLQIGCGVEGI